MKYYIVKVIEGEHKSYKLFSSLKKAKKFSVHGCPLHYWGFLSKNLHACKCKQYSIHEVNEKLIEKRKGLKHV